MNDQEVKKAIEAALQTFLKQPLAEAALYLFKVLGYASQRRLKLSPNTLDTFIATFDQGKTLNDRYALPGEWKSIDFLFQLTDDEIRAAGNKQFRSESQGTYDGAIFNSYLFFALELQGHHYTRTALAGITRELNKLFDNAGPRAVPPRRDADAGHHQPPPTQTRCRQVCPRQGHPHQGHRPRQYPPRTYRNPFCALFG